MLFNFYYSTHIFRNVGVGVSSMMARIGAILAPYIVLLVRKLPLISHGACFVAQRSTDNGNLVCISQYSIHIKQSLL